MSWRTEGMGNTVGNAEDSEYAGHAGDHEAAEARQDHGRLWKTTEDCAVLQEGKDVAGFTDVAEIVEAAECCGRPLKISEGGGSRRRGGRPKRRRSCRKHRMTQEGNGRR